MVQDWGRSCYILQAACTGAIKIGRSDDVERRREQLQTGCPYEIRILLVLEGQGHLEKKLHHYLRKYRTRLFQGEWFHEAGLGELPAWVYEKFSPETLEMINSDWWKCVTSPSPGPPA